MTRLPHRIVASASVDERTGRVRVRPQYVPYGQTVEPLKREVVVISSRVAPRTMSPAAWLAILAVLVAVAALVGCQRVGPERREVPPPPVAAPVHPWCPECAGLPSLGTEPKVGRRR